MEKKSTTSKPNTSAKPRRKLKFSRGGYADGYYGNTCGYR